MGKLERIAAHEAGHVITALSCGLAVDGATIAPEKAGAGNAGCVWSNPGSCPDIRPLEEFSDAPLFELVRSCADDFTAAEVIEANRLHVTIYARIIQALAGVESDRLFFPDRNPLAATTDMQQAMAHARLIAIDLKAALALIDRARADARHILIANKHQVDIVVEALLEHKTLDGAEIAAVLAGRSLRRKRLDAMAASAEMFLAMTGGGLKPLVI
jgi:ATP-dependent Zn protease